MPQTDEHRTIRKFLLFGSVGMMILGLLRWNKDEEFPYFILAFAMVQLGSMIGETVKQERLEP